MGWLDKEGRKQDEWLEGRKSDHHTHKDGSRGYDVYASRVSYKDDQKISEKADYKNWGKEHVKDDGGK